MSDFSDSNLVDKFKSLFSDSFNPNVALLHSIDTTSKQILKSLGGDSKKTENPIDNIAKSFDSKGMSKAIGGVKKNFAKFGGMLKMGGNIFVKAVQIIAGTFVKIAKTLINIGMEYSGMFVESAVPMQEFNQTLDMLKFSIGEQLAPLIGDIFSFLTSIIKSPILTNAIDSIIKLIYKVEDIFFSTIGSIDFSFIQPMIDDFISMVSTMIDAFSDIMKSVIPLFNKITPIIVKLSDIFTVLMNTVVAFIPPLVAVFTKILDIVIDVITPIIDIFAKNIEMVSTMILNIFKLFMKYAITPLMNAFEDIASFITGSKVSSLEMKLGFNLASVFSDMMKPLQPLLDTFKDLGDLLSGKLSFGDFKDKLILNFKKAFSLENMKKVFAPLMKLFEPIADMFTKVLFSIQRFMKGFTLFGGSKSKQQQTLQIQVQSLLDKDKSYEDLLKIFSKKQLTSVGVKKFAEGGIVKHQKGGIQAIIGEGKHDEAVIPLTNNFIKNFNKQPTTININIPITASNNEINDKSLDKFTKAIAKAVENNKQILGI